MVVPRPRGCLLPSCDLEKFPGNLWSLSGLQASLERQGRPTEAAAVRAQFDQAWSRADTELVAARPRTPTTTAVRTSR